MKRLLTIPETAEALAYSREHVYGLIRGGTLRAVRTGPGGAWRVPVEALDEFIDQCETNRITA